LDKNKHNITNLTHNIISKLKLKSEFPAVEKPPLLILITGTSLTGKSTLAKALEQYINFEND